MAAVERPPRCPTGVETSDAEQALKLHGALQPPARRGRAIRTHRQSWQNVAPAGSRAAYRPLLYVAASTPSVSKLELALFSALAIRSGDVVTTYGGVRREARAFRSWAARQADSHAVTCHTVTCHDGGTVLDGHWMAEVWRYEMQHSRTGQEQGFVYCITARTSDGREHYEPSFVQLMEEGGCGYMANHSQHNNCVYEWVRLQCEGMEYHDVVLKAIRDIVPGEEITVRYKNHESKSFDVAQNLMPPPEQPFRAVAQAESLRDSPAATSVAAHRATAAAAAPLSLRCAERMKMLKLRRQRLVSHVTLYLAKRRLPEPFALAARALERGEPLAIDAHSLLRFGDSEAVSGLVGVFANCDIQEKKTIFDYGVGGYLMTGAEYDALPFVCDTAVALSLDKLEGGVPSGSLKRIARSEHKGIVVVGNPAGFGAAINCVRGTQRGGGHATTAALRQRESLPSAIE